jgi:hypothetical protein
MCRERTGPLVIALATATAAVVVITTLAVAVRVLGPLAVVAKTVIDTEVTETASNDQQTTARLLCLPNGQGGLITSRWDSLHHSWIMRRLAWT